MIDEKKLIAEMEKLPLIHGRYDKKNANPDFIDGIESMYEIIRELVKRQQKVDEWIPCNKQLPKYTSDYSVTVMIASPFGAFKTVRSALYNIKTGWCIDKRSDEIISDIIAWKEPSAPWEGEE